MRSLAEKVRARNKPISSVPDRAECQETGISALSWLRGLERREGRLPLSSGPRASLPALAGRGAASGVYHTPEGSPPGACLDQGLGSTHAAAIAATMARLAAGRAGLHMPQMLRQTEARAYKAARQTHRPREATQCNFGTCKFTRWHGPGDGTDKRRQGAVVSSS